MNTFFTIALSLIISASSWAQARVERKPLESNLMIGAGLFGETGNRARDLFPGAVFRLSYGLDMKMGDKWSVMPGAGIRTQLGNVNHLGWVGADPEEMSMADIFCQTRCHIKSEGTEMVVYIGPQLSFMTLPDTYYIDADPDDPRNGREKFKNWDLALQPGIIFRSGKHWQWGFEASFGLRNMLHQYPELNLTGNVHLHNFMFIFGWKF